MEEISVATSSKTQLIDITSEISKIVKMGKIKDGVCQIFVPHTTAGITINEGADPDVKDDILATLNKLIPFEGKYRHLEGNAPAHIKASIVGNSLAVPIEDGGLVLGTWGVGLPLRVRRAAPPEGLVDTPPCLKAGDSQGEFRGETLRIDNMEEGSRPISSFCLSLYGCVAI